MKTRLFTAVLLALLVLVSASDVQAQKKVKIKPTVDFAPTWEAAVEEAKLLNIPIVLHSHGFY